MSPLFLIESSLGRSGGTFKNAGSDILGSLLDTLFGVEKEIPKSKDEGEFATQDNRNFRDQVRAGFSRSRGAHGQNPIENGMIYGYLRQAKTLKH